MNSQLSIDIINLIYDKPVEQGPYTLSYESKWYLTYDNHNVKWTAQFDRVDRCDEDSFFLLKEEQVTMLVENVPSRLKDIFALIHSV